MSEKLDLFKDIIPLVDQNLYQIWDLMDEEQQKQLKSEFFRLNRYISSVGISNRRGDPIPTREEQEHFIIMVNEYYNKHWNSLQKEHPKLLWKLLCMCSHPSGKSYYHEWIGYKKVSNKKEKFLDEIYPNMKSDEIRLLAAISTDKEIKDLARQYGMDENEIKKRFSK